MQSQLPSGVVEFLLANPIEVKRLQDAIVARKVNDDWRIRQRQLEVKGKLP
jgi:hypothetical protein